MPFKERLGDRRTDLRFEVIGQLWGSLETVESHPLLNLTRGGALIESRTRLTPDAVRAVRFGFNGTTHDIPVRVRHVTPEMASAGARFLVGLEFIEPSAAALEQIDHLVAARLAEMTPEAEA